MHMYSLAIYGIADLNTNICTTVLHVGCWLPYDCHYGLYILEHCIFTHPRFTRDIDYWIHGPDSL